jgi:hypothetical protein
MSDERIVHNCELTDGRTGWMIFCPACQSGHLFESGPRPNGGSGWTFNGNYEKPTFNPSMLICTVRMPQFPPGETDYARDPDGKYLLDEQGRIQGARDWVCHSFVRDGQIQFLSDCTHEYANQTLDLTPF